MGGAVNPLPFYIVKMENNYKKRYSAMNDKLRAELRNVKAENAVLRMEIAKLKNAVLEEKRIYEEKETLLNSEAQRYSEAIFKATEAQIAYETARADVLALKRRYVKEIENKLRIR